ncbi:MAG: hypothetical protein E2579_06540 [Pseudomonas sp.]|nr:glycosyltransferase [Pseudomonas sp.]MPT17402.1 hypothetical protein [Pseudomonas sp.]
MIFGVTRFSVFSPSSNAWKSSREMDEESYKDYLFSDDRLSTRLLIMERFSLPILKAMMEVHDDYHHFITYSKELPQKFQVALAEMVAGCKNLHLVEHKDLANNFRCSIQANAPQKSGLYAIFNLDDDDLITGSYIDQLKVYLGRALEGWAISFGLGVSAVFNKDRATFVDPRECYNPKINIGLALINKYEISEGAVDIGSLSRPSHTLMDRERVVVLSSKQIMWLWARHLEQDTLVNKDADRILKDKQGQMPKVSLDVLRCNFGIVC